MALADEILTRGNWRIVIRPNNHGDPRVPYRDLESTLVGARIQLRGWDFPHFDRPGSIRRKMSSILQETDWNYYREVWEFFQTGEFSYLLAIHEDWVERSSGWGPPANLAEHGPLLGVGDTLFRWTEIFTFASRLATTTAGDPSMYISVEIHGLNGRRLWVDSPRRAPFDGARTTDVETYAYGSTVERDALISNFRSLAVDQTLELFARFGWNPERGLLEDQQNELRGLASQQA